MRCTGESLNHLCYKASSSSQVTISVVEHGPIPWVQFTADSLKNFTKNHYTSRKKSIDVLGILPEVVYREAFSHATKGSFLTTTKKKRASLLRT